MAEENTLEGVPRQTLDLFRWALAPEMELSDFERGFAEEYRKDRAGTMESLADETFKQKYEGKLMPDGQPFTRESFDDLSGFKGWSDDQTGFLEAAGKGLAAGASRLAGGITRVAGEATGSETIKDAGQSMIEKGEELRKDPYITWDEAKNNPIKHFPPFVIQTLIESVPEMALALGTGGYSLAGSGLVALGYAGNILEERSKNKSESLRRQDESRVAKKGGPLSTHGGGPKLDENASLEDWLYSLSGGAGIAVLSKLGLEGAISRKAMKEGVKALGAREVGARLAKGSLTEGFTELPQEYIELGAGRGGIEGLPEMSNEQLLDIGLQALTVGAAGGAVISGVATGAQALARQEGGAAEIEAGERRANQPPQPLPPEELGQEELTQPPPPDVTVASGPETIAQPQPGIESIAPEEEIQATVPEEGADVSQLQPGQTYVMQDEAGQPTGNVAVIGRDENTVTIQDDTGEQETLNLDDPAMYLFRFQPATPEVGPEGAGQRVAPQPLPPDATIAPGLETITQPPPLVEAPPEIASPLEVEQALRSPEQESHLRYEEETARLAAHIQANPNDQQATDDLRRLKGQQKDFLQLDMDTREAIDAIVAPDPEVDAESEKQTQTDRQAEEEAVQTVELENAMAGVRARIQRLSENPTEARLARLSDTWKGAQSLKGFKAMGQTNQAIFDLEDDVDTALQDARATIELEKEAARAQPKPLKPVTPKPKVEAKLAKAETKPAEPAPEPGPAEAPKEEAKPVATRKKEEKPKPKVRAKPQKVGNNPQEDDILTAVALLGGLDRDQASGEWGIDKPTLWRTKGKGRARIKPVFKSTGGMKLDDMAELLHERGYLDARDIGELEQKMDSALRGTPTFSNQRPVFDEVEQEMEAEAQQQEELEQQMEADLEKDQELMGQAIEAGATLDDAEKIFQEFASGPLRHEALEGLIAAKKAETIEVAPETLEVEGVDFDPDTIETEPAPTAAPLASAEKLELARALNRLKTESSRVRSRPTEKNIERLEGFWLDVQRLASYERWLDSNPEQAAQLERDIESIIEDQTEVREGQVMYDRTPPITPEITQEIDAIALRVLPPGVGVDIIQEILDYGGKPAKGRYSNNLIQVAADGTATIDTFNHETIHALRDANLFSVKEWTNLIREAESGKWLEHFGIEARDGTYAEGLYKNGRPTDAAYEEAIADAYRDWVRTGQLPPGPHRSSLQRVFARITELFRDIGRYLMRLDVPVNPRSVFENIASGDVGSRGYFREYGATQAGLPIGQRSVAPQLPANMAQERRRPDPNQIDLFSSPGPVVPPSIEIEKKNPEVESFWNGQRELQTALMAARKERTPENLNALANVWKAQQFHPGGQEALKQIDTDYTELMDLTRQQVLSVINPPQEETTREAEPGTTGAQVEVTTEYYADSPVEYARTPEEAAAASKLIARDAQESFLGIVTDGDGKILGIVRHTTGGISESSVYPAVFAGAVHQIPGAAKVWATHNHPSGTAELSGPDRKLNDQIKAIMKGSDVEYEGILAVPAGRDVAAVGRAQEFTDEFQVPIIEGEGDFKIPVLTRSFATVPNREGVNPLTHSTKVAVFGQRHFEANGKPGLILTDTTMRPIATYALPSNKMRRLRGGELGNLLNVISESNAQNMFYIGENGALIPGDLENLVNFANDARVPVLDVVLFDELGKTPFTALSEAGTDNLGAEDLKPLSHTWYSRGYDEAMQSQLAENLRQDENGKTDFDRGVDRNYEGIKTDTGAVSYIVESLTAIKNRGTRRYEGLPHNAEFSDLHEHMFHLSAAPNAAKTRITNALRDILEGIDVDGQMLLTKKILLDDFAWTAEQGMALPYGLTSADDVAFEQQRLQTQLDNHPDVIERLEKRKNNLDQLRKEMVHYKVLRPEQARNENYAHHQVIAYTKVIGEAAKAGKVRTPKWMQRKGSMLDINANYVQAESSWMQKAYQDISTKKFLNWLKSSNYNKRPEYVKQANDNNISHLLAAFRGEIEKASAGLLIPPTDLNLESITAPAEFAKIAKGLKIPPKDAPLISAYADFQQRIGMSLSLFRGAMKDVALDEVPENMVSALKKVKSGLMGSALADRGTESEAGLWELMGWVTENPRRVPQAVKPALGALSAISKRRAFIREALGESYINPRSTSALINAFSSPDTPTKGWQEDSYDGFSKKMTIFNAKTVPEHTIDAALEMIDADELSTSAEYLTVLRQMLRNMRDEKNTVRVIGAPTYEMILDERIADTLNQFSDPDLELGIKSLAGKANSAFKLAALFSPQRFLKYISNDQIGDLDATFALMGVHGFGFIKQINAARKEIAAVLRGHQKPSKEMVEAIELGVVDSGRTPQEVFENTDFTPTGPTTLPKRIFQGYLRRVTTIASIRENMHRYAAYRYFREKELKGDRSVTGYGASKPELIDAIPDPLHRAAKLAVDAYGNYGGVSVLTKRMAKWPMPFVRFMATNTTRYNQYFLNAFYMAGQEGANNKLRGALVGASLLGRVFALYTAVNIGWNYLFWEEEEEELGPDVRNRLHAIIGRGEDGTIYSIRAQGTLSDYLSWVGLEDVGAMLAGKRNYSVQDFIEKTAKAPLNKLAGSLTPYVKTPLELALGKTAWPDVFAPQDVRDPISHAVKPFAIDQEVNMVRRWMGAPIASKGPIDRLLRLVAYADHPDQVALSVSRARAYKFLNDNRSSNSHLYSALYMSILYNDATGLRAATSALEAAGVKRENIARAVSRRAPLSVLPRALREEFLRGLTPRQREQLDRAQQVSGRISQQARQATR